MSANVHSTAFFGMATDSFDQFEDDIYDKYIKDMQKQKKTIHIQKPPEIVVKNLTPKIFNLQYKQFHKPQKFDIYQRSHTEN